VGLVVGRRFGQEGAAVREAVDVRQDHVEDLRAQRREDVLRRQDGRAHGRLHELRVEEELLRHADAQAAQVWSERGAVVRHRLVHAERVLRVVAGDGLQDQGAVGGAAAHRAGVVQRPVQRHHAAQADAAVGRLEAGDAAERSRYAD
jgi:hypothetical protein